MKENKGISFSILLLLFISIGAFGTFLLVGRVNYWQENFEAEAANIVSSWKTDPILETSAPTE